jgi:hypothetical protein
MLPPASVLPAGRMIAIGRCAGAALLLWVLLVTAAPGGDEGTWVLWTKLGGLTTTPVPWTALGTYRTREECIAAMRTPLEDRATLFEDTHRGVVIAIGEDGTSTIGWCLPDTIINPHWLRTGPVEPR